MYLNFDGFMVTNDRPNFFCLSVMSNAQSVAVRSITQIVSHCFPPFFQKVNCRFISANCGRQPVLNIVFILHYLFFLICLLVLMLFYFLSPKKGVSNFKPKLENRRHHLYIEQLKTAKTTVSSPQARWSGCTTGCRGILPTLLPTQRSSRYAWC